MAILVDRLPATEATPSSAAPTLCAAHPPVHIHAGCKIRYTHAVCLAVSKRCCVRLVVACCRASSGISRWGLCTVNEGAALATSLSCGLFRWCLRKQPLGECWQSFLSSCTLATIRRGV